MICGAKRRGHAGFCRRAAMKGRRRCMMHGGRLNRHSHAAWRAHAPWGEAQWGPRRKRQAVMRALGLPWYGGKPKQRVTLNMAEKAIAIMDEELSLLPLPRDVPDDQKGDLEIFGEAVRASVVLLRETVCLGQRLMFDAEGKPIESVAAMDPQNLKYLSMAQICAMGVTKQGFKAADRQQRNDIIGKLLAAVKAEQEESSDGGR
jgi:hypothetical protein